VVAVSGACMGTATAGATPAAATVTSALSAVSCPTTTDCVAVGSTGQTGSSALVERWNGTTWRVVPTPPTGATDTLLDGVSCSGPDACTAVGYTTTGNPSQNSAPVAERWDGKSWTIQTPPVPPGTNVTADLYSVGCPSTDRCLAVGIYTVDGVGTGSLAELWNGTAWTLEPSTYPSPELLSVSCATHHSCVAVGQFGGQTAADRLDGNTWTTMRPPDPTTPIPGDGLLAVGCTATPTLGCQTVGFEDSGDFSQSTIGYGWSPGTWNFEYTPSPGNRALLTAVSCATGTACVAVGWHPVPSVGILPLFGVWDGTTWRTLSSPLVRGAMDGVACPAADSCTAVGSRPIGRTLVEHWNGTVWQVESSPNPTA